MKIMKTIVTHFKPHLDEICAIWLLKKFHPDCREFELKFIFAGANTLNNKPVDSDPDVVHIGVGRGNFDEHTGRYGDKSCSSASLIWNFICKEGNPPKKSDELAAINRIVQYVVKEDTGQLATLDPEIRDFALAGIVQGMRTYFNQNDEKLVNWGMDLLDGIFMNLIIKERLRSDWENSKIDFNTPWGKGAAVMTKYKGIDNLAYFKGYVLVAVKNPQKGHMAIIARADSEVDLTDVYEKLKKEDPEASWFFHHSKKMLICGNDIAPKETKLSKLSLEKIVKLLSY